MKLLSTATLALTLAGPCLAGGDRPARSELISTTLDAIRESPGTFKDVRVTFPVQFASIGSLQNPFFTRFVSNDFTNFHAWSDHQAIWRKDQYDDVFGYLFLSKENEQIDELFQVHVYDRMQLVGVVRDLFQGEPWIEVQSFELLTGKVDTPTLAHLYRGEQHMSEHHWTRAISELSLAPVDTVPDHVRAVVHRDIGLCYLRQGEAGQAVTHLEIAMELAGENDRETAALLYTAQNTPAVELDRQVALTVPDYDRPMWEAFELVQSTPMPTPAQ